MKGIEPPTALAPSGSRSGNPVRWGRCSRYRRVRHGGVNRIVNVVDWPAVKLKVGSPWTVNISQPDGCAVPERTPPPSFEIVSVRSTLCPTATPPKSISVAETEQAGVPGSACPRPMAQIERATPYGPPGLQSARIRIVQVWTSDWVG